MSSFNVAQILPSLDSGGVERGTIEVANYLSELNLKNLQGCFEPSTGHKTSWETHTWAGARREELV